MSAPTTPTNPDGLTFEQAWAEIVAQNREALVAMIREVFRESEDERLRFSKLPVTQDAAVVREASRKARKLKEQIDALAAEAVALEAELSETRKAQLKGYPYDGAYATLASTGVMGPEGTIPFTLLTQAGGRISLRMTLRDLMTLFGSLPVMVQSGDAPFKDDALDYLRREVGSWPIQSETSAMSGCPVDATGASGSDAANAVASNSDRNPSFTTRPSKDKT